MAVIENVWERAVADLQTDLETALACLSMMVSDHSIEECSPRRHGGPVELSVAVGACWPHRILKKHGRSA